MKADEQDCEQHFLDTYSQDASGRYMVRLPFKKRVEDLKVNLGDSYNIALKTLMSMERKFDKNPVLKEEYEKFMSEFERLGHMKLAPIQDVNSYSDCYFLPHHGVLQGSKKLRMVFNASAKVDGVSLNDLLHTGPKLIPDLANLILKWRRYEYVFVCDIEKMYRQFLLDLRDKKYQFILWRNRQKEILIHIAATITYAFKPAPFMAIRTLLQLALDYGHLIPLALLIIKEESYLDDFLSGAYSIE